MESLLTFLLVPLSLIAGASATATSDLSQPAIAAQNSYWYDWGLYGAYPRITYKSFSSASPWLNIITTGDDCDDAYTFIEPRGHSVPSPGPVVLDNGGNLIWMETKYGQAMDLKVQTYKGNQYITFWHGGDSGWFGKGYYLMLDSSYNIFKNITAAGDLDGDLHEFQLTENGTALLTAYFSKPADLSAYGIKDGLLWDSGFQEIDLETGELLFEWRASDHYLPTDSLAPYEAYQGAWDFYHINSVSKDVHGNYLVSSRYVCATSYISGTTGEVLWQVGGKGNSFTDLSDGHATDFSWQHHTRLYHDKGNNGSILLTVFDNAQYYAKSLRRGAHSRGLLIDLDTAAMTARLRHAFVSPEEFLVPSQGSVNILTDSGNVLVGWGHTPAWTEYDYETGEVLCDTHLGATKLANFGRVKNYRTFKSDWVGRPDTAPDAVLSLDEGAVYVSWNGATEVVQWVVQSAWADDEGDSDDTDELDGEDSLFDSRHLDFFDVANAAKEGFETKIDVTDLVIGRYLQVLALDADGNQLGCSDLVDTDTGLYVSGKALPVPEILGILQETHAVVLGALTGVLAAIVLAVVYRKGVAQKATAAAQKVKSSVMRVRGVGHNYDALPQMEGSELTDRREWDHGGPPVRRGASTEKRE